MGETSEFIPRQIMARVKEIELRTRRAVEEFLVGRYHSAFRGRGIEFHEVREYLAGDDIRDIDWNVTARLGRPFVKTYVEERELTLVVLFDASPSMSYGSTGRSKRIAAVEVLALLAMSAVRNDDRVGMLLHGVGKEPAYYPPRKDRDYALRIIRDAYLAQPHPAARASRSSLKDALKSLLAAEKRKAVLIIIGDFLEATGFETPLEVAAARHDCVAALVYDPLEQELPPAGIIELEDPETTMRISIDASSRAVSEAWARRFQKHRTRIEDLCARNRIDFIEIRPDRDVVEPLVRLFGRRTRRFAR